MSIELATATPTILTGSFSTEDLSSVEIPHGLGRNVSVTVWQGDIKITPTVIRYDDRLFLAGLTLFSEYSIVIVGPQLLQAVKKNVKRSTHKRAA